MSAKLVVPASGSLEARLGHQGRLTMYVDKEPIASVDVRRISPDESAPTQGGSVVHTSTVPSESKSGNVLSEWMLVLKRVTGRLFGAA